MKHAFLVCCFAFTVTSCVETIVMDPHEEMPAVVYCVLSNKTDLQTLDLSAAESASGALQYSCLENPMDGGAW